MTRPVLNEPKVMVYPPDGGAPQEHFRFNATDLVRHNGWSFRSPEDAKKQSARVMAIERGDAPLPAGFTQLDIQRRIAQDMGIRIDPSWGISKIKYEIEEKKRLSGLTFDALSAIDDEARGNGAPPKLEINKNAPPPVAAAQSEPDVSAGAPEIPAEVLLMQKVAASEAAEDSAIDAAETAPASMDGQPKLSATLKLNEQRKKQGNH